MRSIETEAGQTNINGGLYKEYRATLVIRGPGEAAIEATIAGVTVLVDPKKRKAAWATLLGMTNLHAGPWLANTLVGRIVHGEDVGVGPFIFSRSGVTFIKRGWLTAQRGETVPWSDVEGVDAQYAGSKIYAGVISRSLCAANQPQLLDPTRRLEPTANVIKYEFAPTMGANLIVLHMVAAKCKAAFHAGSTYRLPDGNVIRI